MKQLVLFIHTSLDGFVAGPNGEMQWIHADEDMFDYAGKQADEADMALYGRITYEMMQGYWPTAGDKPAATKHEKHHSGWYNKVDKVIVSKTMRGANLPNTKIVSDHVAGEISKLKQASGKNIVMFGSPSIAHILIKENLIDDYWIFINPILIGNGIPLFKDIKQRIKLNLVSSHAFASGVVCLHYEKS